jgi:hypothetical protein
MNCAVHVALWWNTTASTGAVYAYDFENQLVPEGAGISIVYRR